MFQLTADSQCGPTTLNAQTGWNVLPYFLCSLFLINVTWDWATDQPQITSLISLPQGSSSVFILVLKCVFYLITLNLDPSLWFNAVYYFQTYGRPGKCISYAWTSLSNLIYSVHEERHAKIMFCSIISQTVFQYALKRLIPYWFFCSKATIIPSVFYLFWSFQHYPSVWACPLYGQSHSPLSSVTTFHSVMAQSSVIDTPPYAYNLFLSCGPLVIHQIPLSIVNQLNCNMIDIKACTHLGLIASL